MEASRPFGIDLSPILHDSDVEAFGRLIADAAARQQHTLAMREWAPDGRADRQRGALLASALRVDAAQCAPIHAVVAQAAAALDVRMPEVFIARASRFKPELLPSDRPILVLPPALVDEFTDEESRFLVARELGRAKLGQASFHFLAGLMSETPGQPEKLPVWLQLLLDWDRKSELTADRAGLLVAQDLDLAIRVLAKIASGARRAWDLMDAAALRKQLDDLEAYVNADDAPPELGNDDEPLGPIFRALELRRWTQSEEWPAIRGGEALRKDSFFPDPPIRWVTSFEDVCELLEKMDLGDTAEEGRPDHAARLDLLLKVLREFVVPGLLPANCYLDAEDIPTELEANLDAVPELKRETVKVVSDHGLLRRKIGIVLTPTRVVHAEDPAHGQCFYDQIGAVQLGDAAVILQTRQGRVIEMPTLGEDEAHLLARLVWRVALDEPIES